MMIEWNKIIYADCMNEENGLPTLEDKSVDLCITDPPFNVNFKGKNWNTYKTETYTDKLLVGDYKKWCASWFHELERICNGIVIFPGNPNLWMWSDIKHPRDLIINYIINNRSIASMAYLGIYNSIICYGKFKRKLKVNVISNLRKFQNIKVHPCPGNLNLYYTIIKQLRPDSVLDIFMGSGTTAEVCTKLGVPWLGYEINEVYSQDINKRLKNCKKEPKQMELIL